MKINPERGTIALSPLELHGVAQFNSGEIGALAVTKMREAVIEHKDQTAQILREAAAQTYFPRRTRRRLKRLSRNVGAALLDEPEVIAQAYSFTPEYVSGAESGPEDAPPRTYDFPLDQTAPVLHDMLTSSIASCIDSAVADQKDADYLLGLAHENPQSGYDRAAETAAFSASTWRNVAANYLQESIQLEPFLE